MKRRTVKDYFNVYELRTPLLSLPILAENERRSIEVSGSRDERYMVNLAEMSCSCPDWAESRVRFHKPDIRRACKHIVRQFHPDRFVLKGEKLAGRLVPIPPLEFRLGCIEINGSLVLFRCAQMRRWYFDVIAPLKGNDEKDFHANFRTDMSGWADRFIPKYADEIKRYLRKWLNKQPEFEEGLPPLPQSVLGKFAERKLLEELDKEKCFVCGFQLSFTDKTPEALFVCCPRCESFNVLTQSGRTNTPERLRLYRKYDGDRYDTNIKGLFSLHENDGKLDELRSSKERELNEIRRREREIWKRFRD